MRCYFLLLVCLLFSVGSAEGRALKPEMVNLPKGSFTMGNDTEYSTPIASNKPAHKVTVSKFKMSKYEVTNREFADFLNKAEVAGDIEVRDDVPSPPSEFVIGAEGHPSEGRRMYELSGEHQDGGNDLNHAWIDYDASAPSGKRFSVLDSQDVFGNKQALDTEDWPVSFVPWNGAAAFAMHHGYALPTEAQREYAAKGGQDRPFGTDDGTLSLANANYSGQTGPGVIAAAAPGHAVAVGSYAANPFGIYDLAGNVWEWAGDFYEAGFYGDSSARNRALERRNAGAVYPVNRTGIDGTGDDPQQSDGCVGGLSTVCECNTRLKRGGSWNFHQTTIRSDARNTDYVFRGNDHFGFCVVGSSSKPKKPGKLQSRARRRGDVELTWRDSSNNESYFEVQWKPKGGKWSTVARAYANVEGVTLDGLTAGTRYKCRVRARNAVGNSGWRKTNFTARLGASRGSASQS